MFFTFCFCIFYILYLVHHCFIYSLLMIIKHHQRRFTFSNAYFHMSHLLFSTSNDWLIDLQVEQKNMIDMYAPKNENLTRWLVTYVQSNEPWYYLIYTFPMCFTMQISFLERLLFCLWLSFIIRCSHILAHNYNTTAVVVSDNSTFKATWKHQCECLLYTAHVPHLTVHCYSP